MALLEFDADLQDDIARLPPAELILGFTKMFDELAKLARERDASAEDWMSGKPLQPPPTMGEESDEEGGNPDDIDSDSDPEGERDRDT
jgi:hypothetical protein